MLTSWTCIMTPESGTVVANRSAASEVIEDIVDSILCWQLASMLSTTASRASSERRWVVYNDPDTGNAFWIEDSNDGVRLQLPHVLMQETDTVKPALVTTCLQRPHFLFPFKNCFSLNHVLKEPIYKDHFLCFPWVVGIDRFDCIYQSG